MRRLGADPAGLAEAADIIRQGGIVAFPTDTLYGLAADPFNVEALREVFAAKGRAAERALPLVAADVAQIERSLGALPPSARVLAGRFWPGPLTLLVPAPAALPGEVTGGTGRVGVRVPASAVARDLCRAAEQVLTSTSANRSGGPATADPDVVAEALRGAIAALVDGGPAPGGLPSTIVDVTGTMPRLVRGGAVRWEEVDACLRHG